MSDARDQFIRRRWHEEAIKESGWSGAEMHHVDNGKRLRECIDVIDEMEAERSRLLDDINRGAQGYDDALDEVERVTRERLYELARRYGVDLADPESQMIEVDPAAIAKLEQERDDAREIANMVRDAWARDCPDAAIPRFVWELPTPAWDLDGDGQISDNAELDIFTRMGLLDVEVWEGVTRVEVIDHRPDAEPGFGRVYASGIDPEMDVEIAMQDDGRTLKILLTGKRPRTSEPRSEQ